MFYRYMYCCYPENERLSFTKTERASAVSVSYFEDKAFLYFETETKNLSPEEVIVGNTKLFPDGKKFLLMPDVFHYSRPEEKADWERKNHDKKPWVRINRLSPENVSKYLYYHYQYQEERPGGGPDKYGAIFMYNEYLVHYLEFPFESEENPPLGALDTNNTPADDTHFWNSLMKSFFIPWDDVSYPWREMLTCLPDGEEFILPHDLDEK